MKCGMKIGIIKCHHFAKFKENRAKDMGSKSAKLNFAKMLKNDSTIKRFELEFISKIYLFQNLFLYFNYYLFQFISKSSEIDR